MCLKVQPSAHYLTQPANFVAMLVSQDWTGQSDLRGSLCLQCHVVAALTYSTSAVRWSIKPFPVVLTDCYTVYNVFKHCKFLHPLLKIIQHRRKRHRNCFTVFNGQKKFSEGCDVEVRRTKRPLSEPVQRWWPLKTPLTLPLN